MKLTDEVEQQTGIFFVLKRRDAVFGIALYWAWDYLGDVASGQVVTFQRLAKGLELSTDRWLQLTPKRFDETTIKKVICMHAFRSAVLHCSSRAYLEP